MSIIRSRGVMTPRQRAALIAYLGTQEYLDAEQASIYFNVSQQTARNWARKGFIRVYKRPGSQRHYYCLDEIELALASRPNSEMRDGRTRGGGTTPRIIGAKAPEFRAVRR